jgi:16S rRNA (guanine966-N2)-methyltransferase
MKNESLSQLRIIAGQWRGRKINFLPSPGLRPTPNRIRETLFNWLAPYIQETHCLDAFAGSGALGFEALSRGAKSVVMIDQSHEIIKNLQENAKRLNTEAIEFHCDEFQKAIHKLKHRKFDIVFLDPPFHKNLVSLYAVLLDSSDCLVAEALIYIEAEATLESLELPTNWEIIRSKKAGEVGYHLIRRTPHD